MFSRPDEGPFVTEDMKVLRRNILREYEKRGKSQKYNELKLCMKNKKEKEVLKYKEKILDDVRNGNRNSTYSALRKLGVRPGDNGSTTFHLPAHVDRKLSPG